MKAFINKYFKFTALLIVLTSAMFVFGFENKEITTTIVGAFLGIMTSPKDGE